MSAQSSNQKRKKTMHEPKKKNPRSDVILNPAYSKQDFKDAFSDAFQNKKNFTNGSGAEVKTKPFPYCILPDFLGSEEYVSDLQSTVQNLDFKIKHNDLYKFSQTSDFKSIQQRNIKAITGFLYRTFLPWMSEITGCSLSDSMDLSASRYDCTDYLLCHNDQLSNRKIAFIYYLVSDWSCDDGGTLDFFDTCHGLPHLVSSSVIPKYNSFVFFEVTPNSYHQVSEVLRDKSRYAISGWYHDTSPPDPVVQLNEHVSLLTYCNIDLLKKYVNPIYLSAENMSDICCNFEDTSEIQLPNFLKNDVYELVCGELKECKTWTYMGPPHKRSYDALDVDFLPEHTKNLYKFLHSKVFSAYFSALLGLDQLISVKSGSNDSAEASSSAASILDTKSPCMAEVGKCCYRSYSLLHDLAKKSNRKILDAFLFFNCEDWDSDLYGGIFNYVDDEDTSSLISFTPTENTLSLLYREETVQPFLMYINHKVNEREIPFFNFMYSSFYENEGKENGQ